MPRANRIGPLDPIYDVETQYGGVAVGNTPGGPIPRVTINVASGQPDPTGVEPVLFDIVFSEDVTGFITGDVTLSGTVGGTLAQVVTGTGDTYQVSVTGMTTAGTLIAHILSGKAVSVSAGVPNMASTSTDNTVDWLAGQLENIAHWWDTSQSVLTISSGQIVAVEDLTGTDDLGKFTNGAVQTTLNGHTVGESFLTRGNSGNTNSGWTKDIANIPQPWSFVCAFARRDTGLGGNLNGTGAAFDLRNGSSSTNPLVVCDSGPVFPVNVYYNGIGPSSLGAGPAYGSPCVVGIIANGASSEIWRDGSLVISGNVGSEALDLVTLFNTWDSAFGHDLYIMEAQAAPGVEPNMAQIGTILLAKWS